MKQGGYLPLDQEKEELTPSPKPKSIVAACSGLTAVFSCIVVIAVAGAGIYLTRSGMDKPGPVLKQGAGLLFWHDGQVLLLLRNSIHNNNTWGLPGGNLELTDTVLLDTAVRESIEEMGSLPDFEVLTEVKTRRGKDEEKHYSVFVCKVQQAFEPVLNYEHSTHRWFNATSVPAKKELHPVVKLLFSEPHVKELAAAVSMSPESIGPERKPKKLGAGIFFVSEGQALLLTRNSTHNNATLSVPGGNVDLGEKHPLDTAQREAVEEMGSYPEYTYKGEINTWRGKHNQKEFKIFLAAVTPSTKESFKATLDHESLAWGWYPLDDLKNHDLHPVVEILVKDHMQEIKAAFGLSG